MEHGRFGCFFSIQSWISAVDSEESNATHCFIFSAQTHLKQVSSTSNLGYTDHYISGSSKFTSKSPIARAISLQDTVNFKTC